MMQHEDWLVREPEVCRLLKLSRATIRRLRDAGSLPIVRPTGRRAVRYRLGDVRRLIDASEQHKDRTAP